MPARTGKQYLAGLREQEREVWLEGERVKDPTRHPGLRGDPLDRRRCVPILAEQPMRRIEDPKAGALGLLLADSRNVTPL